MKLTLSVIKADIGSIGGHSGPSHALLDISCAAFCVHEGKLPEPQDAFAHPFWVSVRDQVARKAIDLRHQGFFGAAMLPMSELEYTGVTVLLDQLAPQFHLRPDQPPPEARTH